jgi:hypothetical protein
LTEMDFLTVSVKMAQTFEATTIRGKRGTFITLTTVKLFMTLATRGQCYKTFYGRKLHLFIIA